MIMNVSLSLGTGVSAGRINDVLIVATRLTSRGCPWGFSRLSVKDMRTSGLSLFYLKREFVKLLVLYS